MAKPARRSFPRRHPAVTTILALVILSLLAGSVFVAVRRGQDEAFQQTLEPFYEPPDPLPPGKPGDVIRIEPVDFAPAGSQGWRLLFRSEGPTGEATVSSGLAFAPVGPAPPGGRPVVAWAHGTVGMGDPCAPSRSRQPVEGLDWLPGMLARGWVVTAPDYAGLGTPGISDYLVGAAEGHDVLNSVRAARGIEGAGAGRVYAVWGHSQGGHAALFAAQLAAAYTPELHLVGVSAAAPAAELVPLINEQWQTAISWIIGPSVALAWPDVYPGLSLDPVLHRRAEAVYRRLAERCIEATALAGLIRQVLGQRFFSHDPTTVDSWRARLIENTPATLGSLPVHIVQGLTDDIVLPNTTAALVVRYYAAGSPLTVQWLGGIGHLKSPTVAGPDVTNWLADRFAGRPAPTTCDQPLPVTPAG